MSDTLPEIDKAARSGKGKGSRDSKGRFQPKGGETKTKASKTSTKRSKPGRPTVVKLQDELRNLFTMIGVGLTAGSIANPRLAYDGDIILQNADRLADGLREAADKNPAVKRALEMLVVGSSYAVLLTAVSNVLVPIAANHGLLPAEAAGLVGAPIPPTPRKGETSTDGPGSVTPLPKRDRPDDATD